MKRVTDFLRTSLNPLVKAGLIILVLGILSPLCGFLAYAAGGFDDSKLTWLIGVILWQKGFLLLALGLMALALGVMWHIWRAFKPRLDKRRNDSP